MSLALAVLGRSTNTATAVSNELSVGNGVIRTMAVTTIAPLGPAAFPRLAEVKGVRFATSAAGIRYQDRDDLLLVSLQKGSTVAGVFTRSSTASAPVLWCRDQLVAGHIRALIVNSGNANTFTGIQGKRDVRASAEATATMLGCSANEVFVASTGVIGEHVMKHVTPNMVVLTPKHDGLISLWS